MTSGTFLDSFIDRSLIPKCIFIHIPKCAGTSVRNNFHLISSHEYHATATTFIDALERTNPKTGLEEFLKREPFTVVRNPFDRAVSWFFYHRKAVWSYGREDYKYEPIYKVSISDPKLAFEKWVLDRCPTHWDTPWGQHPTWAEPHPRSGYHVFKNDPRPAAVWRQLNWLEYNNEVIVPSCNIVRYEELEDTIPQLRDAGQQRQMKRSKREKDYRDYYTNPKLIDIVTELCKDDLDHFGYQFGD